MQNLYNKEYKNTIYNIDPLIWGKHIWSAFHYITVSYPDQPSQEEKENFKNFITYMTKVLPCQKCRYHASANMKNRPLTDNILASRYELIKWGIDFHNDVNIMLGKNPVPFQDAIMKYTNNQYPTGYNIYIDTDIINIVLLVIIIIILVMLLKNRYSS